MKLKIIFLGVLVLLLFASHLVSASPAEDEQSISITITSPGNGTKFHSDVVPHRLRVMANISSKYEIVKVTLDSGWEFVEADPSGEIEEYIHMDSCGTKSIVVTAYDEKGNSVSETTTFTIFTGPPPPPEYTIQHILYGRVTDSTGEPIQGCQVMINSTVWSTRSNVPLGSTNVTDIDGSYLIENIYGPEFIIAADKEGYQQYKSVEGFESTIVEFNIIMTPEEKESPGFGFILGIAGIAFAAFIMIFLSAGRRP